MNAQRKPKTEVQKDVFRILSRNTNADFSHLIDTSAESAIIRIVIDDASMYATSTLKTSDFSNVHHVIIWGCIGTLIEKGHTQITQQLLIDEITSLEMSIGIQDIAQTLINIQTIEVSKQNLVMYARRVAKSAYLIRLAHEADSLKRLLSRDIDEQTMIGNIQERFFAPTQTFFSFGKSAGNAIDLVNRIENNEGKGFILSGFAGIDEGLGGFVESTIEVFAGGSGIGKTEFAYELLLRAGENRDAHWALFTCEMTVEDVQIRMLSMLTGIHWQKILPDPKTGKSKLNPFEKQALREAAQLLDSYDNIHIIDDYPKLRPNDVKSEVSLLEWQLFKETGIFTPVNVIVDGIWHMKGDFVDGVEPSGEDWQQQEKIIDTFHQWQKLGGVHHHKPDSSNKFRKAVVILLAQYGKGISYRNDKRPTKDDIEGSKRIVHTSDRVWGAYRENYWDKDSDNGNLVWYSLKSRYGRLMHGKFELAYNMRYDDIQGVVNHDSNE